MLFVIVAYCSVGESKELWKLARNCCSARLWGMSWCPKMTRHSKNAMNQSRNQEIQDFMDWK